MQEKVNGLNYLDQCFVGLLRGLANDRAITSVPSNLRPDD